MMNEYVIIECAISVGVLAYVWFVPVNRLRRDSFRADIRRLRDDLFDFMWENSCDFSTPAYVETRQTLNGFLRLSNSLSILRFFLMVLLGASLDRHRNHSPDSLAKVEIPSLKKKIEEIRTEAVTRMLKFLFTEGATGLFLRLLAHLAILKHWVRQKSQEMWLSAYELGSPSLSTQQRSLLH